MTTFRFANRASALTTAALSSTATSLNIEVGGGALFPSPGAGEASRATLISSTGSVEIVDITAISGDVLTIARAKEGTAAQSFASGSRIEQRVTAGVLSNFLQKSGDKMSGALDMQANQIKNPTFGTHVPFTNIGVTLIRPAGINPATPYSASEPSIFFPSNTDYPRLFDSPIVNIKLLGGLIFAGWFDPNNLPGYLWLCDGQNGTPDLRGLFIKGATPGVQEVGATHAAYSYTGSAGAHAHGGNTQPTALNAANLPPITNALGTTRDIQSGNDFLRVQSVTSNYAGSAAHLHPIQTEPDHFHTLDPEPSFMCLLYVMFKTTGI